VALVSLAQEQVDQLVAQLRASGGDSAPVEVKSAAGGMPATIAESMCALSNLPGGGILILGLDESSGFQAVGLGNPQALKQGLGSKARLLVPPAVLSISDAVVDGAAVVVVEVAECPNEAKPCRLAASRRAYLRSYDGDFQMSEVEEQGLLRSRTAPMVDRLAVSGTSTGDLDQELLGYWIDGVRDSLPQLSRFVGDELLLHAGVTTNDGLLTRSGLLMLGTYPQQFFPQMVVRVIDARHAGLSGERARNIQTIDGAIPRILSGTIDWLRSSLDRRTVERDGAVVDIWDLPLEAMRELIANALVHRDIDDWSQGMAVELRLEPDRAVVTSPGGLYGTTVDRLGIEPLSCARNAQLFLLGQAARSPGDGARVVEAIASGLPRVAQLLRQAGLPPARYIDQGVKFTVLLAETVQGASTSGRSTGGSASLAVPTLKVGSQLSRVYAALRHSPGQTVGQLATATGIPGPQVRRSLTRLRNDYGLVRVAAGGRGRTTTYEAVTESAEIEIS
jgi:ATP-dependent DNA helicase RecG